MFPSFYEGQGLPAQEAAVSGVPVLTSKGSPMEELLGERALYVDPNDTSALALGIRRLIKDDGLRQPAQLGASTCADLFHWDRCVDGTLAAYHRAVKPSGAA